MHRSLSSADVHISFICTGNICRSPAIERLFRSAFAGGSGVAVHSAGTGALVGQPIQPPMVALLEQLYGPRAQAIDAANAEVVRRLDQGVALLTAVGTAGSTVADLADRTLLHCGPAIEWADVCDPLRRSMRAASRSRSLLTTPSCWSSSGSSGGRSAAPIRPSSARCTTRSG